MLDGFSVGFLICIEDRFGLLLLDDLIDGINDVFIILNNTLGHLDLCAECLVQSRCDDLCSFFVSFLDLAVCSDQAFQFVSEALVIIKLALDALYTLIPSCLNLGIGLCHLMNLRDLFILGFGQVVGGFGCFFAVSCKYEESCCQTCHRCHSHSDR